MLLSQYWFTASKNEGEKKISRKVFDSNLDSFQVEQFILLILSMLKKITKVSLILISVTCSHSPYIIKSHVRIRILFGNTIFPAFKILMYFS